MDTAYVRRFIFSLCAFSLLIFLAGGAEGQTIFSSTAWQNPECGGSALGDFDNDGWPDVFRTECRGTRVALMHNEGDGKFADRTGDIQTAMPDKLLGYGQTFADYDNDGDLDLFVAFGNWNYSQRDRNLLLRNDRGVFTDVAQEAGLTDVNATDNAVWLDYDRDGWLDLYTANLGQPEVRNLLYRNNGDGTFADVTAEAGLDVSFSEEAGGSNGALAAGDFNDDGWPDLYVAVFRARNRLFLNDGQGRFVEITSEDLGDPGQAFDVAVGDFDNDGDLDLFQATGGLSQEDRSLVLLNLGEGEFLDVTEAVGISVVGDAQDTGFGDIDDDGDLDLTLGQPRTVFRNDGGIFVDITDQAYSGDFAPPVAFWDYDLDGHLDGQGYRARFLNNGNGFHTLQVELVGIESNRNGIGARLISTTGDLRQMREIMGGFGFNQDEMVAHFGLGERTQVDELEIRWPSGQVDVLTDIPADQKIRVIEGRGTYHAIEPTRWEAAPPDSAVLDSQVKLDLAVRPALFEPDASITEVTADLSPFGGVEGVPLKAVGDGSYHLRDISLSIEGVHGWRALSVMVDQATSLGNYWIKLSRQIAVLPSRDTAVFNENAPGEWQVEVSRKVKTTDLAEAGVVHTGSVSGAFQVEESLSGWSITFRPETSVEPLGYSALRFAIRPGDVSLPDVPQTRIALNPGKDIDLLDRGWLDLNRREWQIVEIPLSSFDRKEKIESIFLFGTFGGMLYLDDIRLVAAAAPPAPSATAVLEEQIATLPQSVTLDQNYPNPFNSSTIIRFALPADEEIELAVFNLTGQKVATLAEGVREASSYTVHWDGRDDSGHLLSSGVYLYRLRAGQRHIETRKLLLLR